MEYLCWFFTSLLSLPNIILCLLLKELYERISCRKSPHKSFSKISFYFYPHVLEQIDQLEKTGVDAKQLLEDQYSGFSSVIQDEDYVAAASSHKGLLSGNIIFLTFGK